jgi:malonyl-CoA O-methyltransferase
MTTGPLENSPVTRRLDLARVVVALRRLAAAEAPPWLHGEVARRMGERLAIIRARPTALLDWWGFAGAGEALLAQAYPEAQRRVVEPTPALRERSLEAARRPWWSPRRLLATASQVEVMGPDDVAAGSVQLVWANMMLHGVADPTRVLALWHRALAVDGFVMFSCLGPDTLRELRDLYRRLGWPPAMAEFVDMHDLGDMLVRAGFADPVMDQEVLRLSWPDPAALLAELRGLGGNASPDRHPGLRTPRWRARLLRELEGLRGDDGRIHLRVEVAYGHAFKVAPRAIPTTETTVSLDEMRTLVRKRDARD